jgi:hypothetical protein
MAAFAVLAHHIRSLTVLNDHVIHHSLAVVAGSGRQVARMAPENAACITRKG